jgi:hypothetical protein
MADAKLGIIIEAKNEAAGQLRSLKQELQGVNQFAGVAKAGLAGMAAAIGVGQVVELSKAMMDLGRQGAQVQRLGAAFDQLARQAGSSGQQMLAALREASNGAIADEDLMLAANRAMLLGVAASADDMARLLDVASVRARAMGMSVGAAFNDIVTGIGRQSPLILDNLGITVDVAKANEVYAAAVGKTAAALTDQERKQALVNAVLSQSAGLVAQNKGSANDLATSYERLDASVANLKNNLGRLFAPTMAAVIGVAADRAGKLATNIENADKVAQVAQIDREIAAMQTLIAQRRELANLPLVDRTANQRFDPYPDAPPAPLPVAQSDAQLASLERQLSILQSQRSEAMGLAFTLEGMRAAQAKYNQAIWDSVSAWDAFQTAAQQTRSETLAATDGIVQRAQGGLAGIARELSTVQGVDGGVAWLRGANETLERQIGLWADAGYNVGEISNVLLPQYLENLDQIIGKVVQANQAAAGIDVQATIDAVAGRLNAMALAIAEVSSTDDAFAWLDGARGQLEAMIQQWDAQGYSIQQITGVLLPQYLNGLDQIVQKEIVAAEFGAQIGQRIAVGLGVAIGAANQLMSTLGSAMGFAVEAITGVANSAMPALNSQASQLVGNLGPSGALGWLDKQTAAVQTQIVGWMDQGYTVDQIQGVLMPAYLSQLREANTQIKTMGGGVSSVSSQFGGLVSKVQGVISGATTLDVGIKPEDFLPREDAINENARRLAAIMRDGFAGQEWLGEFQQEVPALFDELVASGNPRQAAARMLQEFQQGLRPELLDREQIKQRVKTMLLGESNSAALAQEIAAELSGELGISLAQAQQAVGSVLGTGGASAGMTGEAGSGIDGAAQAQQFTDAWVSSFNGMLERFYDTGSAAGTRWGAGFMAVVEGGVPGQLIAVLVGLVTPGVMANMAAGASRTGAQ